MCLEDVLGGNGGVHIFPARGTLGKKNTEATKERVFIRVHPDIYNIIVR